MKGLVFTFFAVLVFALAVVGCQSLPPSRVVRLLPNIDATQWRFSVNGSAAGKPVSHANLTNYLARLSLRHGDVILFGNVPHFNPSQTEETREWLSRYFDDNKVAMYVYPDSAKGDVFSVLTYHWVAPFENPRSLDKASFFHEGKFLGAGMDGYQKMVREIQRSHVRRAFVLGSLYDINSGFGPLEAPYESQKELLDNVLTKSGTELLLPSQLPGF